MNTTDFGIGEVKPADAEEYAKIKITVCNGIITQAEYECSPKDDLKDCVNTVCSVITDKPVTDIMQMNNNAVYYNTKNELPRNRLYLASIAVLAAKKAVVDFCKKTNTPLPPNSIECACFK